MPCFLAKYLPRVGYAMWQIYRFTLISPVLRVTMEMFTHFSQCLFMFGIAVERYILVCHPIQAKLFLTPRKRFLFCSALTALLLIPAVPAAIDFYDLARGKVSE